MLATLTIIDGKITLKLPEHVFSSCPNRLSWGIKELNLDLAQRKEALDTYLYINDNDLRIDGIKHLQLAYDETGCLRLGPMMGLLISQEKKKQVLKGDNDTVYSQLAYHMNTLSGVLIFFSVEDLDLKKKVVNGYVYEGKADRYIPVTVPIPRAIYDRCFTMQGRAEAAQLRTLLGSVKEIKIFNSLTKLGKLETYELLSQDRILKDIVLPNSVFSIEKLKHFMEHYDSVYIKPDLLYKGEGIIRVSKKGEEFYFDHHRNHMFDHGVTTDLRHVVGLMENFGEISPQYVIQKKIDLACLFGNPYDVRVMLQKNGYGEWEVSGTLARIGVEDCLITSPRSGGKVLNLRTALSDSFRPAQVDNILYDIDRYCKRIGQVLENHFGLLGELGIDLGVDKTGRVWLIEVNGKPLKVSMKRLKDATVSIKLNRNPCSFGAYLDGFCTADKLNDARSNDSRKHQLDNKSFNIEELRVELRQCSCLFKNSISMNRVLADRLGINLRKAVALKMGVKNHLVHIQDDEQLPINQIGFSRDLLKDMGLYSGSQIGVLVSRNNILWLGPLFAVMLSTTAYEDLIKTENEIDEMKYSEKIAYELGYMLICFTVQDIKWNEQKMFGCYFNRSNNAWEEGWFPLPDVVYNLATFPQQKKLLQQAKEMLQKFQESNQTLLLNTRRYFGKSEAMTAVEFFKDIRHYIPETQQLNGPKELSDFIDKWQTVFVKSEFGSYGMEVMCIEKGEQGYSCEIGGEAHEQKAFSDFDSLYRFVKENEDFNNAVIQQGIKKSSFRGRTFDLRIIVNKLSVNVWKVILVSMRLAPFGNTITNISSGGLEVVPPFNRIKNYIPQLELETISKFTSDCAVAIESWYGPQGVLGIDAAVDDEGRLWLLEVNSKPAITEYLDLCQPEHAYKFYSAPLKYGGYMVQQTADIVHRSLLEANSNPPDSIK